MWSLYVYQSVATVLTKGFSIHYSKVVVFLWLWPGKFLNRGPPQIYLNMVIAVNYFGMEASDWRKKYTEETSLNIRVLQ